MTHAPALSVVIPAFNAEGTIGELLTALSEQQWGRTFEVIVCDNGCTDDTVAEVAKFENHFTDLKVIDASTVKGAGYARNRGADTATATRLVFIDADDVPGDGWLAAIGDALDKYSFVASRHDGTRLNTPKQLAQRDMPQANGLQEYTEPPFLPHSGGCGLGIRKAIHDSVGGFDEAWLKLQDTDYCWRVQLAGTTLVFVPQATVYVRMRDDLGQSYRQAFRWAHYNVRLYKKFRPLGMPKLSWQRGIRWWLYHLGPRYVVRQLKDADKRPRWFWQISWRFGRLVGSIRYLTWAL